MSQWLPQEPLVEFAATDDYARTHELIDTESDQRRRSKALQFLVEGIAGAVGSPGITY